MYEAYFSRLIGMMTMLVGLLNKFTIICQKDIPLIKGKFKFAPEPDNLDYLVLLQQSC